MAKLIYWSFFLAIPMMLYIIGLMMAMRCSARWNRLSKNNGIDPVYSTAIEIPKTFIDNAKSWPFVVKIGTIAFPLYSLWRVMGKHAYGGDSGTFASNLVYTMLVLVLGLLAALYISKRHADIYFANTYGSAQSDVDVDEAHWKSTVAYICFWLFVFTTLLSFS